MPQGPPKETPILNDQNEESIVLQPDSNRSDFQGDVPLTDVSNEERVIPPNNDLSDRSSQPSESDTLRSQNPLASSSGPNHDPLNVPMGPSNADPEEEESRENIPETDDVMNVSSDEPVAVTPPPGRRQRRAPRRLGDWVY